jgi:hypothetical protein
VHILPFATSEWLRIAPTLVSEVRGVVELLPPGATLQEYEESRAPRVEVSVVAPTALPSSTVSSSTLPPRSRSPSSGSGLSRPSPHTPAAELSARPTRALPRRVAPSAVPVPPAPVASSASASAPSPVLPSPAFASTSAAGGLFPIVRTSTKRPVPDSAELPLVPMDRRPREWRTCVSCTQYKSKCAPAVGTRPPYVVCTACLNRGRLCEPRPLEPKKSKKEKSSPAPPPKSGAAAAPLRLEDEDKLALLLPGDLFPNGLPSLPIHGASGAPLGDLII